MPALQFHADGKAVVQFVRSPSMLTRLNEIALRRGINRSRVIREAIERVYFASSDGSSLEQPSMTGDSTGGIGED